MSMPPDDFNAMRGEANGPGCTMSRRDMLKTAGMLALAVGVAPKVFAQASVQPGASEMGVQAETPSRPLNPRTQWLYDARWGLFTHFLAHKPSHPVPAGFTPQDWNRRVNGFDVRGLAEQLVTLGCPYYFLTVGQMGGYFCSPNEAYAANPLYGPADRLSTRDLMAELAEELDSRGIRFCAYAPAHLEKWAWSSEAWCRALGEWSRRWGRRVHAWWFDGAAKLPAREFSAITRAAKAGNPDALVAFNKAGPLVSRNQVEPVAGYDDYLAGEVDYVLPTCCAHRGWDNRPFYGTRDVAGAQLHFLSFLGEWWGTGSPRFPDELVIGWVKHTNNHGGTVTWDFPLEEDGRIGEAYYRQLKALRAAVPPGRAAVDFALPPGEKP